MDLYKNINNNAQPIRGYIPCVVHIGDEIVALFDDFDQPYFPFDGRKNVGVDEVIAPFIEALWKKGYMTVQCCSGHWLKRLYCDDTYDDKENYGYYYEESNGPILIEFENVIEDIYPPKGWKMESRTIYYDFNCRDSYISFLKEQVAALDKLNDWILRLPVVSDK